MNSSKTKKTFLIILLMFTTVVMAIEFNVYTAHLNVFGRAKVEGNGGVRWDVRIPPENGITCTKSNENIQVTTFSNVFEASFGIKFFNPGEKVQCKVTVLNKGTLNARLKSIYAYDEKTFNEEPIKVTYYGLDTDQNDSASGTKLKAGKTNVLNVDFEYVGGEINDRNRIQDAYFILNYVQDFD